MGGHRFVSQDSRCQGQVPIENVIGRAFVIVWPGSRWAGLSVPATFAKVPQPFALGPTQPRPDASSRVVADSGTGPIVLSVVAPLVVPARSRRRRRVRQRRLPE